jgi:hypothetical protein
LKYHTFGVKKSIGDKQPKINQLYQEGKRYYPTDGRGNVDEWAAVVKRQTEVVDKLESEK